MLARYPDDDVTIVVLFNTERDDAEVTANDLEERIARLFFAGSRRHRGRSPPSAELLRYVGQYRDGSRLSSVTRGRRHAAAASRAPPPEAVAAVHGARRRALVAADDPSVELRFQVANGESLALSRYRNGWFSGVAVRSAEPFVDAPPRPRPKTRRTRAKG